MSPSIKINIEHYTIYVKTNRNIKQVDNRNGHHYIKGKSTQIWSVDKNVTYSSCEKCSVHYYQCSKCWNPHYWYLCDHHYSSYSYSCPSCGSSLNRA